MKKFIFISAALALILSGCAKETQEQDSPSSSPETSLGPQTISAGFDETKVAMNDGDKSVSYTWKDGDKILFVNPSAPTDVVTYTLSTGAGTSSASFTKSSGDFTSGNKYVCCHPGSAVSVNSDGEFVDTDGKSILKGQNPAQLENYMVFAGYNGTPKVYSFDGASIPTSFGFEAPFTMLKVGVSNTSSAAVTPNGIKVDGGKGSNYFLGTLKVDATSGIAASGAMDYLQMTISSGSEIAASTGTGAYSFMCVQNSSRTFSSLKVSIFY